MAKVGVEVEADVDSAIHVSICIAVGRQRRCCVYRPFRR